MLIPEGGFEAAGAHARRVTLNLMRLAHSCPPDVAVVADKLAENGWDWVGLSKIEAEVLFTFCTQETAAAAVNEFNVDTSTIHDLGRDRKTAPESYIDDDGDTHCPLCGHKHIRWGFVVRNTSGGKDLRCGSTCVEVYGLRVDGEGTAEAALKKLRGAIGRLKKKATREDWQLDHPDHEDDMALIRRAFEHTSASYRTRSWALNQRLGGRWDQRWKKWSQKARATLKYYSKNEFLTADRTLEVYRPEGLLVGAREALAQMAAAIEGKHGAAWKKFFVENPSLSGHQAYKLRRAQDEDLDPADLPVFYRRLYEAALRANGFGESAVEPDVDDMADLPF